MTITLEDKKNSSFTNLNLWKIAQGIGVISTHVKSAPTNWTSPACMHWEIDGQPGYEGMQIDMDCLNKKISSDEIPLETELLLVGLATRMGFTYEQMSEIDFINRLVNEAKKYGWNGDYIEIVDFVRKAIKNAGLNPDDYDLAPNPDPGINND